MNKRYIVRLRDEERETLRKLISTGEAPAYQIRHAPILLKVDADGPNWTDEAVAEAFGGPPNTVAPIRRRFGEGGLEAALACRKRPYPPRRVDGEVEARIIALRCRAPPEGHSRWTLRLLADKLVELEIVPYHLRRDRAKGSKKPTPPSLEGILCDSSRAECWVCGSNGRHSGPLPAPR